MNDRNGMQGKPKGNLPADMRQQLAIALDRWANAHPRPDEPIVHFGVGRALSPKEVAAAVRNPTLSPEGPLVLAVFAHALTELPRSERPTVEELVSGLLQGAEAH